MDGTSNQSWGLFPNRRLVGGSGINLLRSILFLAIPRHNSFVGVRYFPWRGGFGQQKPETCILGVITNLHHHRKNKVISLTPGPSDQLNPSAYTHHGASPSISPLHSPSPSASRWSAPAHAPSPTTISSEFGMPIPAPTVSLLSSSIIKKATPPPSPLMALPPPPPNEECTSLSCTKVWNPIYMIRKQLLLIGVLE